MDLFTSRFGILLWIFIGLATVLLPILALIDIVSSSSLDKDRKVFWILIVLLLPFFGSILYFLKGTRQRFKQ